MRRVGLYLGFPPEAGGAFQYAQSMLQAISTLPADRYEIVVVCAHPAWTKLLRALAGKIRCVEVTESLFDPAIRFALRLGFPLGLWHLLAPRAHRLTRRLMREANDFWFFPAQDVLTYALPTRTIGTIHDLMHRYERRFPEVSKGGLFARRERHYRNLCAHASAVLVDSNVGEQQVTESYPVDPARIYVLPYVAPDYVHSEQDSTDFDARYRLPARFIFYPAQFWEHKNHVRLLQALAVVRRLVPDLHLVLCGSPKNAYADVTTAVNDLNLRNYVHVFGYVPDRDIAGFYRRARAMMMPTFFGPTNIPPLEAMATGCPMAISGIYAMPEQVGDAAIFFDPSSVDEIAHAMYRLTTDDALCARLVAAGKRRTLEWGQAQFNERLSQIIESLFASV